jgi:hypothetical protein
MTPQGEVIFLDENKDAMTPSGEVISMDDFAPPTGFQPAWARNANQIIGMN